MRAMTVVPGVAGSAAVTELDQPAGDGDLLVDGIAVGICGTDLEIAAGQYGTAPPGTTRLVLGHESVGRVASAPSASGFVPGDIVVGIVRRPDPDPCAACAVNAWDMCLNGRYTERGIKQLDGYGAQQWRVEAEFALRVDPALGDHAVLIEPASVVAKAWDHVERILARAPLFPRQVLVTGAGPIGLLAALLGVQRGYDVHVLDRVVNGPKPDLVADLGATYHTGRATDLSEPDIVLECTGAPQVVVDVIGHTTPGAVVCLTGVSSGGRTLAVDVGAANRQIVLENDVVFGSVNANRSHYEAAAAALAGAPAAWLSSIITRRVPLESWTEALERRPDDVKVIVELGPMSR